MAVLLRLSRRRSQLCDRQENLFPPGVSFGLTEFAAAMGLWFLLWWLNRAIAIEGASVSNDTAAVHLPGRLLWTIPVEVTLSTETRPPV